MSAGYEIAPIFLIRLTGPPFDALAALATAETISVARELLVCRQASAQAASNAENFFRSPEHTLSEAAFRALLRAVRQKREPIGISGPQPAVFSNYARAIARELAIEQELNAALERDVTRARRALWENARMFLPQYLVFSSGGGVRELQADLLSMPANPASELARRNARSGDRERHLLLYLQRVCAKNDTFGEFGPTAWGSSDKALRGVQFVARPGIHSRDAYFERWVCHAIAGVISADPDVFIELSPRLNPSGKITTRLPVAPDGSPGEPGDHRWFFSDTGEEVVLTAKERQILENCDGETPIHALPGSVETIRSLIERNILVCAVEVPALEPRVFDVLREDLCHWRPQLARDKWMPILDSMAELSNQFADARAPQHRQGILDDVRIRLRDLGIVRKPSERVLYSAQNPIGEECFRNCEFRVNQQLIDEVAVDAAPWIDFWRDTYAFVAGRVAAGLRPIFAKAALKRPALPLAEFLKVCEESRLPLTGPGLVALATVAFQQVKSVFHQQLQPHLDRKEYELTAEDCHVVRQKLDFPAFDEYTYPSADLQISATSIEALNRGEYQWILSELHPAAALLHHCMYWACPDKERLNQALARAAGNKANFHFGFFAADFTAHTTVRLFDALPNLSNFVSSHRGRPGWRIIRPADTEVYVDGDTGDIGLRVAGSREYLGSFARAWVIPLGFHPFQFGYAPHTPRFRCGRVVVQRRSWTVTEEELPAGDYTGVSRDLVVGIERLRAEKDWPRYVYVRPSERALRRSGAEGRDKDTKPVFIDFESYLFQEIFQRWLAKAGELEVTEMLPDPDHLLWAEADGRRTFELRTLIVPRTQSVGVME